LLVAALKAGAPVLGAAPRYDSDPTAQLDRIFALAREFDVDLDLHLDVGDSPEHMDIQPRAGVDRAIPARRPGRGRPHGQAVVAAAGEGRGAGARWPMPGSR